MNQFRTRMHPSLRKGKSAPRAARRNTGLLYALACFLFLTVLVGGAAWNDTGTPGRILYQTILFALCAAPFFLGGHKPAHRLLVIFLASYYLLFGMAGFFSIVFGLHSGFILGTSQDLDSGTSFLSKPDWVILIGALCFLAGYFLVSALKGGRPSRLFARDWKPGAIFKIALLFLAVGLTFSMVYDLVVSPIYIPHHILGIPLGIASNFRLFVPFAAMMFIYLLATGYRPKLLWTLLILIMATEFVFGFVANSKEISYLVPALLVLGLYFLRGAVSKKFIVLILVSFIPYLLFFNVYRLQVLEISGQTRTQALSAFDQNATAVAQHASREKDVVKKSLLSLMTRLNGKVYVDIIVHGTDSGQAPFLEGKTLTLFFDTFIPRMFWPGKPNSSTGEMFNHAFQLSQSRYTFVPTTQLGELYWNFGMTGVVVGMLLIGVVFGYLGSAFSMGRMTTLPRFMVLLLAAYYLAIRFEVNIALQYSTFIRLVLLVAIVDFFIGSFRLHRRPQISATTEGHTPGRPSPGLDPVRPPRARA